MKISKKITSLWNLKSSDQIFRVVDLEPIFRVVNFENELLSIFLFMKKFL